jgi:hypothetical protein
LQFQSYFFLTVCNRFDAECGPLKFRVQESGILFCSIGYDLSDDGGNKKTYSENKDIVFCLGVKPTKEKSVSEILKKEKGQK